MEFQDVLLFNFFKDSPFRNWRLLYTVGRNKNDDNLSGYPVFDERRDHALCHELKALYVGVTRAKTRLWYVQKGVFTMVQSLKRRWLFGRFYDLNAARREIMIDYWNRSDVLISYIKADEASSPLARKSTVEEWSLRGESFKEKEMWEQAVKCFRHAKNEAEMNYCCAMLWKQEAEKLQGRGELREATYKFHDAASLFEKIQLYQDAGTCYYEASEWTKAVENFRKCGDDENALRTCVKGDLPDLLLSCAKDANCSDVVVDECCNHLAIRRHGKKESATAIKLARAMRSTAGMRRFFSGYKYFDVLIELDKEGENYDLVAEWYIKRKDWAEAIEWWKRAGRLSDVRTSVLQVARCQAFILVWGKRQNKQVERVFAHLADNDIGLHSNVESQILHRIVTGNGIDSATVRKLVCSSDYHLLPVCDIN